MMQAGGKLPKNNDEKGKCRSGHLCKMVCCFSAGILPLPGVLERWCCVVVLTVGDHENKKSLQGVSDGEHRNGRC